jgi:K+-transporting ATPase ATPase C chain
MNNYFRPAFVLVMIFTLITGLVMPLVMCGVAGVIFPGQAGGSLVSSGGKIVGSRLIGQNFAADGFFHGRPSAITTADPKDPTKTVADPYDAGSSSGSNLAPTSQALVDRVKADIATAGAAPVPADAVTTSASGLDPDISPDNAARQVPRIAAARHVSQDQVRAILAAHVQEPIAGFIGQPRVNVLELNLALGKPAEGSSGKVAQQ